MATLLKILNNLANIKSAGGVALRLRTQDYPRGRWPISTARKAAERWRRTSLRRIELPSGDRASHRVLRERLSGCASFAASQASIGESVAGIDLSAFQARGQPLLAHGRGAVGEAVWHGVAARCGLQPVVADRLCGRERPFDVPLLEDPPFLVRVGGPDAGEAIGLQLDPYRKRVGLGLAMFCLASSTLPRMPSRSCT